MGLPEPALLKVMPVGVLRARAARQPRLVRSARLPLAILCWPLRRLDFEPFLLRCRRRRKDVAKHLFFYDRQDAWADGEDELQDGKRGPPLLLLR